jgi:4a-hydroxytetrahydrobiopterin dehydratase
VAPSERRPLRLSPEEIAQALEKLPGWRVEQQGLRRSVTFGTFMDAIEFVGDLAHIAEELDHHPDIDVRWRTVRLTVATHDAGGAVTERDVALAGRAEQLLAARTTA